MRAQTIAGVAASALVAALLSPGVAAVAATKPPSPAAATAAPGKVSAAMVAQEAKAKAAQAAKPTEAQRLAAAAKSGNTALAISTSSIAAMKKVQTALVAVDAGKVRAASAVGATITPHYFGPYGNYANSPQHLPTALVTFSDPPHSVGWRLASGTAIVNDLGVVTGVEVTDGGAGYTSAPVVTIGSIGAGSGATATATLTGAVGSVSVVQAGLGYNDPVTVTFTGGGGTGAAATAALDTHGAILSMNLTAQGSGYTSRPAVSFTDGVMAWTSKALATATFTKIVKSVTVTHGGSGYITPGLRKFVDTLPVLGSVGVDGTNPVTKNDLGQYIPVAIPDTTTYPGSDYYEIAVVQYRERMHADLPAQGTLLRGYVQLSTAVVPGKHVRLYNETVDGRKVAINLPNGDPAYGVDSPHYLGPIIGATKNRPDRVLFRDLLPIGVDGDLFLPVDTTVMGAGAGPKGTDMSQPNMGIGADMQNPDCGKTPKPTWCYTENRANIHLHGGATPWISDGTPHQWITPAGETTDYPAGVSVQNVPDMPDPGPGAQTFFYTNQQSARLLFYHDHSWGITRLNVYAGEASAYVITDSTEQALVSSGTIPDGSSTLPLIIEDKTYIPSQAELSVSDPTWDTAAWGAEGSLWAPHVYMTAQNTQDSTGVNQFGRWMYGPWFWPPTTDLTVNTVMGSSLTANPYAGQCITGTDWCEPSTWTKIPVMPAESMGMESYNDTPVVNGTAYPVLTVDPKSYRFRVLNAANDRFWNLSLYKAAGKNNTEVALVAADVAAGKTDPIVEPKVDESISTPGPSWVQIGTEGGFLPTPAVIPPSTIGYITDPTVFDFGNINKHSLLLGPAERADVIVDFSKFAGQTLIMYNDAPAAAPARDPRYDYYTDHADLRSTGGAAPTPEGYGPNTRTIMQIKVAAKTPAKAFDLTKLNVAFQATELGGGGVFENSQHPILVGQAFYNQAYGTSFGTQSADGVTRDGYVRMTDNSLSFNTLSNADQTNAGDVQNVTTTSVAMHDEMGAAYDKLYGRMSGSMGQEADAIAPGQAQNLTLYPYTQPPTEVFNADELPPGDTAVQIATPKEYSENIQFWKITHNGVDSHPIHFHLADVQLINRVSWDGIIRLPDANEIGWKDTVRVNPLSDTIVAFRPLVAQAPFGVAKSFRSPNPAMPEDADPTMAGFVLFDRNQNPWNVTNAKMDFGWEYVWHCHILSHEEMDMMRPIKVTVGVAPPAPSTVWFTKTGGFTVVWNDPTPASATGGISSSWGDPTSEIGYRIERAPDVNGVAGDWTQIGTALANQTTFNDPAGATTPYFYRVVAWNAADAAGTTSAPSLGVAPAGAPLNVAATPALNGVGLGWAPPAVPGAVAGAAQAAAAPAAEEPVGVTGYAIGYSTDNGLTWTTVTADTGSLVPAYTVTGLTRRGAYVFRVAAITDGTPGPWSLITATVSPMVAPERTTHVTVVPANRAATVSWTAPQDGGTPITGYSVSYSTNGIAWLTASTSAAPTARAYTVTGLTNGAAYFFKVSALSLAGGGQFSTAVGPVTPFTFAASSPVVSARPAKLGAQVSWGAPPANGSAITGYQIAYRRTDLPTWVTAVSNTRSVATARTVTGLAAGKHYVFRVRAINAAGVGPVSVTSPAVVPFTVPSAPTHLSARAGHRVAALSWRVGANGGRPITGYQILYSTNRGKTWIVYRAIRPTTRATVLKLVTGRTYWFRVRAISAAGVGASSASSPGIRTR